MKIDNHPFILDGLVRVDLFKSNTGNLVVNELESLNAGYGGCKEDKTNEAKEYLSHYWQVKFCRLVRELI